MKQPNLSWVSSANLIVLQILWITEANDRSRELHRESVQELERRGHLTLTVGEDINKPFEEWKLPPEEQAKLLKQLGPDGDSLDIIFKHVLKTKNPWR